MAARYPTTHPLPVLLCHRTLHQLISISKFFQPSPNATTNLTTRFCVRLQVHLDSLSVLSSPLLLSLFFVWINSTHLTLTTYRLEYMYLTCMWTWTLELEGKGAFISVESEKKKQWSSVGHDSLLENYTFHSTVIFCAVRNMSEIIIPISLLYEICCFPGDWIWLSFLGLSAGSNCWEVKKPQSD
jgi:hypothetical protein